MFRRKALLVFLLTCGVSSPVTADGPPTSLPAGLQAFFVLTQLRHLVILGLILFSFQLPND